jgi:uncharacterized lipoprotein NlpE involved in copper resistance
MRAKVCLALLAIVLFSLVGCNSSDGTGPSWFPKDFVLPPDQPPPVPPDSIIAR